MRSMDSTRSSFFLAFLTCSVALALIVGACNSPTTKSDGESTASIGAPYMPSTSDRAPASIRGKAGTYGLDSSEEYYTSAETKGLKAAEHMGRDMWIKATVGNDRYNQYGIGARLGGAPINFWKFLKSRNRNTRFNDAGLMNDPDCCTPGTSGCPMTSLSQTYGMDYCPGDDELLKYVGRKDAETAYRDPACDMPSIDGKQMQSACDLKFGTSAGAVGFRKFPNPRFDRAKWEAVKGNSIDNWDGYSKSITDMSLEPPFRIGISCAMCHISFDPVRPPADPNHPTWMNLSATAGSQYLYIAHVFGSGFAKDTLERQAFTNSRPGVVDTSAFPNDQVHNPGTANAIINFTKRPTFTETVNTWRRVSECPAGSNEDSCTCNPQGSRCYQKATLAQPVLHVLKGGEDSVGEDNAVMRVYVNIGACAEQCWMNHLTDIRVFDKSTRNYGQTPFDIGQCRRDCPGFRALEDRVEMERNFLLAANSFDLYKAKNFSTADELIPYIENERKFGEGSVARGRQVYAQSCARCHSSQKDSLDNRDFLARDPKGKRIDWLSNEERINADEVGTFECRSQHSNHQKGHVWEAYGSEDYQALGPVRNLQNEAKDGRGRYRPISLLSVWAFAPFMHNNAVGPEVCAASAQEYSLNVEGVSSCTKFDPSVEGRLTLFERSMDDLLHPEKRGKKRTLTSADMRIPLGPRLLDGNKKNHGFTLVIPKGISVARIGSFRHRDFISDMGAAISNQLTMGNTSATPAQKKMAMEVIKQMVADLRKSKNHDLVLNEALLRKLGGAYSNCTDEFEDKGHNFGSELPEQSKKDLTAFMETL